MEEMAGEKVTKDNYASGNVSKIEPQEPHWTLSIVQSNFGCLCIMCHSICLVGVSSQWSLLIALAAREWEEQIFDALGFGGRRGVLPPLTFGIFHSRILMPDIKKSQMSTIDHLFDFLIYFSSHFFLLKQKHMLLPNIALPSLSIWKHIHPVLRGTSPKPISYWGRRL